MPQVFPTSTNGQRPTASFTRTSSALIRFAPVAGSLSRHTASPAGFNGRTTADGAIHRAEPARALRVLVTGPLSRAAGILAGFNAQDGD